MSFYGGNRGIALAAGRFPRRGLSPCPGAFPSNVSPRPSVGYALPTAMAPQTNTLCWSPRLGLYLAVPATGTICYLSRDGISWYLGGTLSTSTNWYSAIWCDEFRRFVLHAFGGAINYSNDGRTWLAGTSVTTGCRKMGYSPKHKTLILGRNGQTTVVASTDGGITWTQTAGLLSSGDNLRTLWIEELDVWVNVATNGAVRWSRHTGSRTLAWSAGSGLNGFGTSCLGWAWSPQLRVAVAIGASLVGVSRDCKTWVTRRGPPGNWISIQWLGSRGMFVALSHDSSSMAWSRDGLQWATRSTGTAIGGFEIVPNEERNEFLFVSTTESTSILL